MSPGLAAGIAFQSPGYLDGLTLRSQWQTAFEIKPQWIIVTGWNEHIAQVHAVETSPSLEMLHIFCLPCSRSNSSRANCRSPVACCAWPQACIRTPSVLQLLCIRCAAARQHRPPRRRGRREHGARAGRVVRREVVREYSRPTCPAAARCRVHTRVASAGFVEVAPSHA